MVDSGCRVPEDASAPGEMPVRDKAPVPDALSLRGEVPVPEDVPAPEDVSVPEDAPVPDEASAPDELFVATASPPGEGADGPGSGGGAAWGGDAGACRASVFMRPHPLHDCTARRFACRSLSPRGDGRDAPAGSVTPLCGGRHSTRARHSTG
ncbi:MAGE-like protein 2 [Streptomyces albus]|nr:MAGE-like protein 2 [Streptomyces albus]AYN36682.1 MAGE-like protein 2 [Streptomyces albus]